MRQTARAPRRLTSKGLDKVESPMACAGTLTSRADVYILSAPNVRVPPGSSEPRHSPRALLGVCALRVHGACNAPLAPSSARILLRKCSLTVSAKESALMTRTLWTSSRRPRRKG